jgi:Lipocalin-like domain
LVGTLFSALQILTFSYSPLLGFLVAPINSRTRNAPTLPRIAESVSATYAFGKNNQIVQCSSDWYGALMIARILSLIVTVIFAISFAHAQTLAANPFVGTWKLIAADKLLTDGTRAADYGAEPHGMAIFAADGHFMVEVFRDVRLRFAGNDRAKGTPEEYKDASLSSSCLFGSHIASTRQRARSR